MKKTICALLAAVFLVFAMPIWATNYTEGEVWVLDTTGAILGTDKTVHIEWIMWTGCTTDDHDLIIRTESGGNYILYDLSGKAGEDHIWYFDKKFRGLYLDTLDSGEVVICIGGVY